jgi:hypothetical protein
MWSDELSVEEAEYTQRAIDALQRVAWARSLLHRVETEGGLTSANMPLLFEVRFAYELHLAGVTADYEHATGIGDSTVDFRIQGKREWLVELVSLRETEALKKGTRQSGQFFESILITGGVGKQSEEDEMMTAQGKIGEKVFQNGKPSKFPLQSAAMHLILVDMRGYLGDGGDSIDYQQMANGASAVSPDNAFAIHRWNGRPILGLFEQAKKHPLRAAPTMQERVHFLGFISEAEYREREIRDQAYYRPNPRLLPTPESQLEACRTYPLLKI